MTYEFKEGDMVLFKVSMDVTEYVGTIDSIIVLPSSSGIKLLRYHIVDGDNGFDVVRAGHRIRLISIDLTELLEL